MHRPVVACAAPTIVGFSPPHLSGISPTADSATAGVQMTRGQEAAGLQGLPIRCVVVDDHEALRAGLVAYLDEADGIEVVGEAARGDVAVAVIERRGPDVAIVDLSLPDVSGLEVCELLSA